MRTGRNVTRKTTQRLGFGLIVLLPTTALAIEDEDSQSSPGDHNNVVGGSQVSEGDWEDAAAIYFGWSVGCTGVLVAPDVVLTAGHCIGGISDVHLGTNDYTRGGEVIEVEREVEYTNSWTTYDIGVLILAEESSYEPRMIASGCVQDDLHDGTDVQIVGYGATDIWGNNYGTKLMEAQTTVNDHDCSDLYSGCNSAVSPGGEISAGGAGVDACYGDSGGPLYLLTDHGEYVVGLTSRSYNGVYAPCEEGGIYVRPDAVVDWIEQVSGRTLPTPDCGQGDSDDDDGSDNGSDNGNDNGSGEGSDEGSGGTESPGEDGSGTTNAAPVPEAASMLVIQGQSASSTIQANDPNAGDRHTYTLVEEPVMGIASISPAGRVSYTATDDAEGTDSIRVVVTDDGSPEETALVEIEVEVIARALGNGTGGCATVRPKTGGVMLTLLGMWLGCLRRRD